ncbi:hypothetical protein C3747_54g116 [Trypanosoma cruzi]|uniref:Uncharacterized protein n=1 Tax=Trypanosoma cruzi TaxID=5693 RepID=A0A2V2WV65_TRYCR|nr:hypothetical protein C3747_54g116 [Trypanosoma cruzi]
MRLMDEWMIQKLFLESGWVRQLQENAETAPQHHAVVGEQKILRYMLHRFISDETMWRDDLLALLELLFTSVDQSTCLSFDRTSCHTELHPCTTSVDNSACGHEDDHNTSEFSVRIPGSLFKEPEKMNFYSYGLQNVLWEFLQEDASSFGDTSALWRVFVVSYRNLLSLPSPQRPPFSRYESHPGILGAEFVGAMRSKQTKSPRENSDEVALGDTPQEPVECDLPNDGQEETSRDGEEDKVMMMNDESGNSYLRDRFYMSVIEPGEVSFPAGDARPSGVLCGAGNEHTPERHSGVFPASWRGEREILNPGNGELEDIHLNHLWGIFQKMKLEDSIDMCRAVRHGNLEKLRWEVFMDVLARKGLLLLFFARDEVRALTPPHLTYRRLSRLHQELKVIASWTSTRGHGVPPPSLPSFEDLTLSSRLSFSCFAQLHAPVQRHLYGFATPSVSPAHLYSRYCESYSHSLVQPNALSQDGKKEDAGKTISCETSTVLEKCQFPRFECLSELQRMAFYYSFHDEVIHSSPQLNVDNSCSTGVVYNVSINQKYRTELTEPELFDEPPVAVKQRGRPRRTTPTMPVASDEPPVAVKQRGRPRRTTPTVPVASDEPFDASDEPPVAVKQRGRPRTTPTVPVASDEPFDASDEPPVAVKQRGRPRRTTPTVPVASDEPFDASDESPVAVKQRGRPRTTPTVPVASDEPFDASDESPVAVKQRGRPRTTPTVPVASDEPFDASDEPPVAVKQRGRPRRTTPTMPVASDEPFDASDESPVAVKQRGRPRRTTPTMPVASDEPPVAVKQRGRPRRTTPTVPVASDEPFDASDEPPVAVKQRGRPRTTPTVPVASDEPFDASDEPPVAVKQRGRPRTTPTVPVASDEPFDASDESPVAVKQRGRPRRTTPTMPVASDEPPVAVKQRGRPRRTTPTMPVASDEPPVAVKQRGRPRRTTPTVPVASDEPFDASDEPPVAVKQRGRPRTTPTMPVASDEPFDASDEPPVAVKQRGRPRRTTPTMPVASDESCSRGGGEKAADEPCIRRASRCSQAAWATGRTTPTVPVASDEPFDASDEPPVAVKQRGRPRTTPTMPVASDEPFDASDEPPVAVKQRGRPRRTTPTVPVHPTSSRCSQAAWATAALSTHPDELRCVKRAGDRGRRDGARCIRRAFRCIRRASRCSQAAWATEDTPTMPVASDEPSMHPTSLPLQSSSVAARGRRRRCPCIRRVSRCSQQRGRPRTTPTVPVASDEPFDASDEPPVAVKQRGRPRRTTPTVPVASDEPFDASDEPPVAVKQRGRPRRTTPTVPVASDEPFEASDEPFDASDEPPVAVKQRGRPRKKVLST